MTSLIVDHADDNRQIKLQSYMLAADLSLSKQEVLLLHLKLFPSSFKILDEVQDLR